MLGYIDLIYGIWVYNDELQIKFTFCFGPMICGRVMAFGFWNLAKYLVVISFFAMLGDIDLIFGIWVYNDELQIKFTFCSGQMLLGQLAAVGLCNLVLSEYSAFKFGQIFSWRHFFSLWFEILTWYLVRECIVMSYRSSLNFVSIGLIYAPWTFNFGQIYSCHHFISLCFEILTWFLVFGITVMSYRSRYIGIGLVILMQVL
jgi:hypothetical protein